MSSAYHKELQVAVSAVQQASALCARLQSEIGGALEKSDKSPVTVADFASQAIIARALAADFPNVPLIAEEGSSALQGGKHQGLGDRVKAAVDTALATETPLETIFSWIDHGGARDYSERFWTLDPIDGTKGFLRGGQYAIALALVVDGQPAVSVLGCPNLPHAPLLCATAEGGAQAIAPNGPKTALRVSAAAELSECRFCESVEAAHSDQSQSRAIADALGITRDSIRMDSQAKYATLATGNAEIYLRLPTRKGYVERIWDHAAGYGVLTAAGGRVTDIAGRELDFKCGAGLEHNSGVIASNGPHHDAIVAAVQKHFQPPT
jgi:3'(2'), 5'-bisphosphate nucleotidase